MFMHVQINCTDVKNLVFGGVVGSANNSNLTNCYVFGDYYLSSNSGTVFGGLVGRAS